jgi:uncharacterized protein (DUF427 family)
MGADAKAIAEADAEAPARDHPAMIAQTGQIEPAPRRVRGVLGGRTVFDTLAARYVWEWPNYPQYYVPIDDFDPGVLVDEGTTHHSSRGTVEQFGLSAAGTERSKCVRVFGADADAGLPGLARIDWDALDSWFEEDEEVFVHPRNPYVRVDALRSSRTVRVELEGILLAESAAPVMVFETGLPTRYYLDRTSVDFDHLLASETTTACPYKGRTSGYWSVRVGERTEADLAWAYDFPTRQLAPITGLVAFYNEKVDISIDGEPLPRPKTHFFK